MLENVMSEVGLEVARMGLFPGESETLRRQLYEAALCELDLPLVDYQLIRDLTCLAETDSDAVLEAGLIALLSARAAGSLCVRLEAESIKNRLPEFEEADEMANQFVENVHAKHYDETLIGRKTTDFRPLIVRGDYLYFQKSLHNEETLRQGYRAHFGGADTSPPEPGVLRDCIQQVVNAPARLASGDEIKLNCEQQWALALGLLQRFVVITGGPGTGKTSIVLSLLRCAVCLGIAPERIALAAPTGRAAQRMTESLRAGLANIATPSERDVMLSEVEGQTLHRLLGYSPSRHSFSFNRDHALNLDLLIVDEVSMIDVSLMAQLMEALSSKTRLILLGDMHQLPSVEAGAVLADLVPADKKPLYTPAMVEQLRQILPASCEVPSATEAPANSLADRVVRLVRDYRSAPPIQKLSATINTFSDGAEDELLRLLLPGDNACRLVENALEGKEFTDVLTAWAERHYLSDAYRDSLKNCAPPAQSVAPMTSELKAVLEHLSKARILSIVHQGWRGCDRINKFISAYLRPRLDWGTHQEYFVGQPIMVTRNDYALELFNGDTGVVVRDEAGVLRVAFARGENALLIPLERLPERVPAFAVTVHKSQGSEFNNVLLILPHENPSLRLQRLLSRQILYTAITRARDSIEINSSREVLLQACRNIVQRDSGLDL